MKRFCVILLLLSALPISAVAASYSFEETGGSLNLTQSLKLGDPLQLNGAEIVSIKGPGIHLSNGASKFGWLKLANGDLEGETIAGSKQTGSITDTYTYGAGTMTIFNSLKNTNIPKGVIFSGSLSSETLTITYDYTTEQNSKGKTIYVFDGRTWQLAGDVVGKFYNGERLSGTFDLSKIGKNAATGATNLSGVPEPDTLALLATGLLGLAGLVRRRSV